MNQADFPPSGAGKTLNCCINHIYCVYFSEESWQRKASASVLLQAQALCWDPGELFGRDRTGLVLCQNAPLLLNKETPATPKETSLSSYEAIKIIK